MLLTIFERIVNGLILTDHIYRSHHASDIRLHHTHHTFLFSAPSTITEETEAATTATTRKTNQRDVYVTSGLRLRQFELSVLYTPYRKILATVGSWDRTVTPSRIHTRSSLETTLHSEYYTTHERHDKYSRYSYRWLKTTQNRRRWANFFFQNRSLAGQLAIPSTREMDSVLERMHSSEEGKELKVRREILVNDSWNTLLASRGYVSYGAVVWPTSTTSNIKTCTQTAKGVRWVLPFAGNTWLYGRQGDCRWSSKKEHLLRFVQHCTVWGNTKCGVTSVNREFREKEFFVDTKTLVGVHLILWYLVVSLQSWIVVLFFTEHTFENQDKK